MPALPDLDLDVVGTAAELPGGWDRIAGRDELYLSTPWLRMLEATSGAAMRYLLARNGEGLAGGLATAVADADAPWLSGRPDALLERCVREERAGAADLRAELPADLTAALLPGLVCGGRHLGRNRALVAPGAGRVDTLPRLVDAAEALARRDALRSVSFLYVDDGDRALRSELAARGYVTYVSAAYHYLPVGTGGYAEYLEGLSSHRRRRIEADRRKLRREDVSVDIEPLDPADVPRLARLETELLRRYGFDWVPELSARIFARIHEEEGGAALVSAARHRGEIVGFVLLVARGAAWYAHRAGFDYDAVGDLPVYFDVTYNRPLELAPGQRVIAIHYGTGSDATKQSRGCVASPQHAYTRMVEP